VASLDQAKRGNKPQYRVDQSENSIDLARLEKWQSKLKCDRLTAGGRALAGQVPDIRPHDQMVTQPADPLTKAAVYRR
jgi:hypothetical protein